MERVRRLDEGQLPEDTAQDSALSLNRLHQPVGLFGVPREGVVVEVVSVHVNVRNLGIHGHVIHEVERAPIEDGRVKVA
jgi:hypothetical protein